MADMVSLEQLERYAALQEYLSGEIIFHEGEPLPAQLFSDRKSVFGFSSGGTG
jgi:hypothetical protein